MTEKQEITKERISSTLKKIVLLFEAGDVPKAIAIATFPPYNVPSNHWSLSNRLIMCLAGSSDARGYKSWQQVDRHIKAGEKALYILAPRMIPKNDKTENEKNVKQKSENQEKPEYICTGFVPIPVFALEQTEGKPMEYEKIELPQLPLMEKAKSWNIDVKGTAYQGGYHGYYQLGKNDNSEKIRLATPDETTFFHELAHAAHRRILGKLKPGQEPQQEIVAELSAQVLAQIVGTQMQNTLGNSFEYIQKYAEESKKSVAKACLSVLSDVEKVLDLILDAKEVHENKSAS